MADQPANRGPRPDYANSAAKSGPDSSFNFNEECKPELPPECPPEPECNAEIKQEQCTCDCNEEPPPKCDIDVMVLIDVCSCSPEVWAGIKSYVDSLVTKYEQEIGLSEAEVNVAIVGFASTVKTMVGFGEPVSYDYKKLTEEDGAINKMNIEPFTSQGTYIDKALAHVIDEFQDKVTEFRLTPANPSLGPIRLKESSGLTDRWLQPPAGQHGRLRAISRQTLRHGRQHPQCCPISIHVSESSLFQKN